MNLCDIYSTDRMYKEHTASAKYIMSENSSIHPNGVSDHQYVKLFDYMHNM